MVEEVGGHTYFEQGTMTTQARPRSRYYVRVSCSNCLQECDVWFRVGEKVDTTQKLCTYCRVPGTLTVVKPTTLVALVDGQWRSRRTFRWTKVYPKSVKDRIRIKALRERAKEKSPGSDGPTQKEVLPDEELP